MKKILGLDLGTNSIGWAVVAAEKNEKDYKIRNLESAGSRIIPMDAATLGDFDKGNTKSQTAERTRIRGVRRLLERDLLRRERLNRVLHTIGFLPQHYDEQLGWEKTHYKTYGKFKEGLDPKLAWEKNENGKHSFIFQESFTEMLKDFLVSQPQIVSDGRKVPYDWTIYFLRKKALERAVSKEELAWIILNFNQKRGYYQLRGEELEENPNKLVEFYALKVTKVERTAEKKGNDYWYQVHLENGWIYRRTSNVDLDWEGKIKEFIVTTDINDDKTPKLDSEGNIKRSFRAPKEDDWTLMKKKTEYDIEQSGKTVGVYIYDSILNNPHQKIRGKLVRTIERKYYKSELRLILEKQKQFHAELQSKELFLNCVTELYPTNLTHQKSIENRDFTYLFLEDIIFYQRPLKSKKSLIANCPFERYTYIDKETSEQKVVPIKCIAKSHPLYQEFRLWQFVANIRIYQKERYVNSLPDQITSMGFENNKPRKKLELDIDVTSEFLKNEDDYVALFDWLNNRKEIDQKAFLKYPGFGLKKEADKYRWNYVEDKPYPCNETRASILNRLEKSDATTEFLTREKELELWHILYSVSDKLEIQKALIKFAERNQLNESFVDAFIKFPPFKKDYGSYSAKAIKKLLPLMRIGKYWSIEAIDIKALHRIDKIISGEVDEKIRSRVREKAFHLSDISHFKGLPLWLTSYIVYDRHSEAKEIAKWEKPADIDAYLSEFKQHSMRNPIVEQVILETLRTVRDIWKHSGTIDEIHVELGREMKNPSNERKRITQQITENENTNLRIKALLIELMNPEFEVENVRPYSPGQQDILKIYEEYALNSNERYDSARKEFVPETEVPAFVNEILQKFKESDSKKRPTRSEILRYKLWLEQRYRSPYTGEMIPLGKLFTSAYEIEHIIPQSRYFDDSFSNKVICEAEVNKLKDNALGLEFIKNHQGEIIELNFGKKVKIFSEEAYERFVKDNYSRTRGKMKKLMMEEIPDKFIERQLNDSRYISNEIKRLLSNIVRAKDENGEYEQEAISKNLIAITGGITDRLKKDWGLNDVWNSLVLARFERLNQLTGTTEFTAISQTGHTIPAMPLELQKGFNKKRIDHRHHAMDAIIIACATRDHVNLLNNEAAKSKNNVNRYQLSRKLRRYEKVIVDRNGDPKEIEVAKEFFLPWEGFPADVQHSLGKIIVSFKQNLRVINRATNKYVAFRDENGKLKINNNENLVKQEVAQTKGDSWSIRKPMHKDTVFGEVNLRKIKDVRLSIAIEMSDAIVNKDLKRKINQLLQQGNDFKKINRYFKDNQDVWSDVNLNRIQVYYFTNDSSERFFATRKPLDQSFDRSRIENSITDTGIQKILLKHLKNNDNKPELAFSPDGIDEMNRNILQLNNGKFHQPIYKVRWYEKAEKFAVGSFGQKSKKFVEAAKGTNLFFAIYWNEETQKREYETIPLHTVITHQKKVAHLPVSERTPVPVNLEKGRFLFVLSPNDLVYVPTQEEIDNPLLFDKNNLSADQIKRVYKMVSSSGSQCFFVMGCLANSIVNKVEFSSLNKMEKTIDDVMIKEKCWLLSVNRIGEITTIKNGLEV